MTTQTLPRAALVLRAARPGQPVGALLAALASTPAGATGTATQAAVAAGRVCRRLGRPDLAGAITDAIVEALAAADRPAPDAIVSEAAVVEAVTEPLVVMVAAAAPLPLHVGDAVLRAAAAVAAGLGPMLAADTAA